jgi:signal transduction histidine kinase
VTIFRSLRSRLTLASLLWTGGLLALMHMFSLVFLHVFPATRKFGVTGPVLGGLILMAAGLYGLRSGLTPFRQLRARLLAVRTGKDVRVQGEYPTEVQPLVDDLNALLDDREKAVKRALATAGDLAHGLKTPLAVLAQEAERAEAAGDSALAAGIAQQVERMRRQVDYHLARARAAASGAAPAVRCQAAVSAEGLVRTLLKLYSGRALHIEVHVAPEHSVRVQREDLDEMLGNLLDNACKWATSRIAVESARIGSAILFTVDDDGPGLARPLRMVVLQRGVRADEAAPGSGLGLAIVRDLADLYGGSISLDDSPRGGLRARLSLPAWQEG